MQHILLYSLSLQEKLLVEGLVFVTPLVAATPAGVAISSGAKMASSWLKREVEQVVQTYLFGSSKLSRAKLCPAVLCYLMTESNS